MSPVLCSILVYLSAATGALSESNATSNGLALRRQTRMNHCILPEHPVFGSWYVYFNPSEFVPGMLINEGSVLIVECKKGYTLNSSATVTCNNGKWTPEIGKCLTTNEISERNKTSITLNGPLSANNTFEIDNVAQKSKTTGKHCVLPNYPLHGGWTISGKKTNETPGNQVDLFTILRIKCDDNYKLDGQPFVFCRDDEQWSNPIGNCSKTCPSLENTEVTKVICSYGNKEMEDCKAPIVGTIARIECSPFYKNPDFGNNLMFILCVDGYWDRPKPECVPSCGQKLVEATSLIIGGVTVKRGSYPWHVAVYTDKKELICGGTLVSPTIVLTAASCVTNEKGILHSKENYIVAVGKFYRKYDDPRDYSAQFSKLQNIYVPTQYKGHILNYARDIAVLMTTTSFKLSRYVQPVCVDWSSSYNFPANAVGYVLGWGFTEPNSNPSDQLKELQVPIIDSRDCFKNVPENFQAYLTFDKICAGYLNKSTSVCSGDSGGGLFLERDNLNYIVGVASVGPPGPSGGCNSQQYTAYTAVRHYTDNLINKTILRSAESTPSAELKKCLLPLHPKHGHWTLMGFASQQVPGNFTVSGSTLEISCDDTYILNGPKYIKCIQEQWNSTIGNCLAPCPPISSSSSIHVSCSSGNSSISCSNATHGSLAIFKCQTFYENLDLGGNPFRTCENGQWKPEIPNCLPVCGVKPDSEENYPWNVAIHQGDGKNKKFKCAGSLINKRIVLTSAQCVSDESGTKLAATNYVVVAGTSMADYSTDTDAQYSNVEDIFVHPEYNGKFRRYWADIALVITKKTFILSHKVQLACMDWDQKFSKYFDLPGITASIPASLTSQANKQSGIEIELVNITQCYQQLSSDSSYLTYDKTCSGYINTEGVSKCTINRGVGLVAKNRYDNRYYLTGIASVFLPLSLENCNNQSYILFTQVSKHISNFIAEKNKIYTPVTTPYFLSFCGVKSVQPQILVVGGNNVNKSEYPWQVALYKIKPTKEKTLICGGSLINQRIILTAAHCVTNAKGMKLSVEIFIVAVGKYYSKFDHEDDQDAQFSTLIDIIIPPQYEGELQNYIGDVALLISEKSFVLSRNVQPVCVDWEGKYESYLLKHSATGYVSGWGFTKQNRDPSKVLKDLEVQYVNRDECKQDLPPDYNIFLTFDKLCSGFLNKSKAVCKGDSGGGLVFRNGIDGRYYIFGIVSLSPQASTGGCDIQKYALYTKVSYYLKDFILQNAQLYWR